MSDPAYLGASFMLKPLLAFDRWSSLTITTFLTEFAALVVLDYNAVLDLGLPTDCLQGLNRMHRAGVVLVLMGLRALGATDPIIDGLGRRIVLLLPTWPVGMLIEFSH